MSPWSFWQGMGLMKVKELTKGKQTPATAKPHTVPDFPLVLKK
jgi:hypothetical protein